MMQIIINPGATTMSYLRDFRSKISNHDYSSFLKLWEEYCAADEVDGEELRQVLRAVKAADFAGAFGKHVEKILPLWETLETSPLKEEILQLIVDLETTNTPLLGELVSEFLEKKYGNQKFYHEGLKLLGLRSKENFQGALSGFALLAHFQKGNFVFHSGGWGIGEIVDVSFVREQISLEFDYVAGRKDLSFANAFKTLIPVPKDHFLAMRFGNPDLLEIEAKQHPVEVIRVLLRDLGPKTASEIKDELCDLVIPAAEWTKWWQNARTKIKKDTMIETPEDLKSPFLLRFSEVTHEERFLEALEKKPEAADLIQMVYTFLRDFPETLKKIDFRTSLQNKLTETLSFQKLDDAQELQIYFLLQNLGEEDQVKKESAISELLKRIPSIEKIVEKIEIVAFRKRILAEIKKNLPNWTSIFLNLLYTVEQNTLRDYILGELVASPAKKDLEAKLKSLWEQPKKYGDALLWYFQKIISSNELPFSDHEGKNHFFEALLILLSDVENDPLRKEMVKKIHHVLTHGRYAVVRQIMQNASLADVKEFLLLATKCHSLSDHDIKILHSLAEVVYPSINNERKHREDLEPPSQEIWTTKEGYLSLQKKIEQIATVETVENAKEIEVARSHGDLRENSEFKFALEKRDRLQSELKLLSDQLSKARILTKEDIDVNKVGVGVVVDCKDSKGKKISYTLLGPWDADVEKNILSFQSKLAQAMSGLVVGDTFQAQGETFTIMGIRSYFERGSS